MITAYEEQDAIMSVIHLWWIIRSSGDTNGKTEVVGKPL